MTVLKARPVVMVHWGRKVLRALLECEVIQDLQDYLARLVLQLRLHLFLRNCCSA